MTYSLFFTYESDCITPSTSSQSTQILSTVNKALPNWAPGYLANIMSTTLPSLIGLPLTGLLAILWAYLANSTTRPLHLLFSCQNALFLDSSMAHSRLSFVAILKCHLWSVRLSFPWLFCIRCDPPAPPSLFPILLINILFLLYIWKCIYYI